MVEEKISFWKNSINLEKNLKVELSQLTTKEIYDRFSTDLEFGTGGLRGPMGVGTSRINVHTIMHAAAGFGSYLKKKYSSGTIAISYDNRKNSYLYAYKSALVLSNFNFKVLLFEKLRPTPMLSFAVRYFKCIGGIMITASHNPKEDNGFKAYNSSGAQLNLDESKEVISEISKIKNIFSIKEGNKRNIEFIKSTFDDIYLKEIDKISLNNEKKNISIVYSALHGTGGEVIPKYLRSKGYKVHLVESEMKPDPLFTNTHSTNPENPLSFNNSLKIAEKTKSDLVIVTDPDADRLGIAVKDNGNYVLLTGNESASIMLYFLLNYRNYPENGIIYTTIVTSSLVKEIAKSKNIEIQETLTGFKFIGEKIEINKMPFIFGCEESYGSLILDSIRDKDAVQASILIAEICEELHKKNISILDLLNDIYKKFGRFININKSYRFKDTNGKEKMSKILNSLRESKLIVPGIDFFETNDYLKQTKTIGEKSYPTYLPSSNVLSFVSKNFKVTVRPSGTEPKLKIYYEMKSDYSKLKSTQNLLNELISNVEERIYNE